MLLHEWTFRLDCGILCAFMIKATIFSYFEMVYVVFFFPSNSISFVYVLPLFSYNKNLLTIPFGPSQFVLI